MIGCIASQATDTANPEQTDETAEAVRHVSFGPAYFPFRTTVKDNDKALEAGGWQEARAKLDFWNKVWPWPMTTWVCTMTIGMPLRTQFPPSPGVSNIVTPSWAAKTSSEIVEHIANQLDMNLDKQTFCSALIDHTYAMFHNEYHYLGATVTR